MIVVGVDGSEESNEALRWALAEARLRGTTLRAVHAWTLPVTVTVSGYGGVTPIDMELLSFARDAADELLAGVLREVAEEAPDIGVERAVLEGPPAAILVEEAKSAELLVVGSRGLGGFRGLLLGSVSQQCAQHALCPVVIVRRRPEAHEPAEPR
jgi:nucleotide-binding universal stress UspA family protein